MNDTITSIELAQLHVIVILGWIYLRCVTGQIFMPDMIEKQKPWQESPIALKIREGEINLCVVVMFVMLLLCLPCDHCFTLNSHRLNCFTGQYN